MKRLPSSIIVAAVLLAAVSTATVSAQSADALFQQALKLERVQGDFRGAIEVYQRIADDASVGRVAVARALVQMGKAYESLGRTEAFSVYERVVRDFADVGEQVAEARVRMRGLASPPAAGTTNGNQITYRLPYRDGEDFSDEAHVSDSGRLLARGNDQEGITFLDLDTGAATEVSKKQLGCPDGMPYPGAFSPDETKLAVGCYYNMSGPGMHSNSLAVYDLRTRGVTPIVDAADYFGISDSDPNPMAYVLPQEWSEDGTSLLVQAWTQKEGTRDAPLTQDLAFWPAAGGPPRLLKHVPDAAGSPMWASCTIRSGRVVVGEFYVDRRRLQIHASNVDTGAEFVLRADDRFDYSLYGCDRKSSRFYFGRVARRTDAQLDNASLWVGDVSETGELINQRFLRTLPSDAAPLLTHGGAVIYTRTQGGPGFGVFDIEFDASSGHFNGNATMREAFGYAAVEAYSNDGRQLLITEMLFGEGTSSPVPRRRYVSENGGPFVPVHSTLGSGKLLAISGDRLVHADTTGTFAVNWRTGERLDMLASASYGAVSEDLRYLFRPGQGDPANCVLILDRASAAERELVCLDDRVWTLALDPTSRRVAVTTWDRGRPDTKFSLYVHDPASGETVSVAHHDALIRAQWAGGRLYFTKASSDFMRYDPATGDMQPIDLKPVTDIVHEGSFNFSVRPDEQRITFSGGAKPTDATDVELVVIRDPLSEQ